MVKDALYYLRSIIWVSFVRNAISSEMRCMWVKSSENMWLSALGSVWDNLDLRPSALTNFGLFSLIGSGNTPFCLSITHNQQFLMAVKTDTVGWTIKYYISQSLAIYPALVCSLSLQHSHITTWCMYALKQEIKKVVGVDMKKCKQRKVGVFCTCGCLFLRGFEQLWLAPNHCQVK